MNPETLTYLTMADLFGTYLSHHPKGPLGPESAVTFGVLAGLANIVHGNNSKQQWKDIRDLADAAIKIHEAREPMLFSGGLGIPQHEDHGHGSEVPKKESCKAATRPDDSPLNRGEAMAASSVANRLKGTTLVKFAPEDALLIDNAILTPTQLDFGQYNRLIRLVGVMSA